MTRVQGATVALLLLLGVAAAGCSPTDRETLAVVDGTRITLATTFDRTCIEFGGRDGARSCWGAVDPAELAVVASSVGGGMVVVATAPDDADVVVLRGDGFSRTLPVSQTGSGRLFVGVDVPPGTYEVAAERDDGSVVLLADELTLSLDSGAMTTVTP